MKIRNRTKQTQLRKIRIYSLLKRMKKSI